MSLVRVLGRSFFGIILLGQISWAGDFQFDCQFYSESAEIEEHARVNSQSDRQWITFTDNNGHIQKGRLVQDSNDYESENFTLVYELLEPEVNSQAEQFKLEKPGIGGGGSGRGNGRDHQTRTELEIQIRGRKSQVHARIRNISSAKKLLSEAAEISAVCKSI